MGVFAGPNIDESNLIFYIDGKNINSFPRNGKIIDLITREEKTTTATVDQYGYLYGPYGSLDKFSTLSLSNSSSVTVNIGIANTSLKSGIVFSIHSDDSSFYAASGITSHVAGVTTTTGIGSTSHTLNTVSSGITSYLSGEITTRNTGGNATFTYDLDTQSTGITSHVAGVTTTTGIGSTSYTLNTVSSGLTSYFGGINTTTTYGLYNSTFYPKFELSCYIDQFSILVTNKSEDKVSYLSSPINLNEKNIFSIIFRKYSTNSTPITIYANNGQFYESSAQVTASSQFENVGISVFGANDSNYSQSGVRFISVYNRELNEQQLRLINNLKIN